MQALLPRFSAAHTQVLGVSVDSVYCHANWARELGGISFPLLSDFEPKGAVGRAFGAYIEKAGVDDRATVIIDGAGIVRHASSVTPAGKRNIEELAALCEEVQRTFPAQTQPCPEAPGVPRDAVLFVKSSCGFSRATLLARDNLRIGTSLVVRNVNEDPDAMADLVRISGKEQAPCLVVDGKSMLESKDIIRSLVGFASPL